MRDVIKETKIFFDENKSLSLTGSFLHQALTTMERKNEKIILNEPKFDYSDFNYWLAANLHARYNEIAKGHGFIENIDFYRWK